MPRNKRTKKRKFYGNRFTSAFVEDEGGQAKRPKPNMEQERTSEEGMSSRAKKLNLGKGPQCHLNEENDCNIIINSLILKSVIDNIGKCPTCNSNVSMRNNLDKRKGFACCLEISCTNCEWVKEWFTSPMVERKDCTPGPQSFDFNIRMVFAFREIGKGYRSMTTFGTFMNMPPPMQNQTFNRINSMLHEAYESVAEDSMKEASREVHNLSQQTSEVKDCQVSVDGTWQKRGYSSLNGVVTVISSKVGKCLDVATLSKYCKSCQHWSKKKDHPRYDDWQMNHICSANHSKSSGAMESVGAVSIFSRSVDKHKLRYTEYIGDGDSSSFQEVEKAKPYGKDIVIKKLECVGHVQKRVGSRCRNLRKSLKGVKLSDGKGIAGRGRLTDKAINTLQNYYGMAIRSNTSDVMEMKKAVGAVLFHCSNLNLESERHKFCPTGEGSWCKWQSDRVTGKAEYKKKLSLPDAVKEKLKPIFAELSSHDLLSKCMHGLTQNANESLNNIIWKKCPKRIFVTRAVLEMAVYSAIIDFNNGMLGLCKVAKELGLENSHFMERLSYKEDSDCIRRAAKKYSEEARKRRKKLRAVRKKFIDEEKDDNIGLSYDPGSF